MDALGPQLAQLAADAAAITVAFALALPIAWERGKGARSSGFRTMPIVAIAACGVVLILDFAPGDMEARARVVQGVIAGTGFVCGGAILKGKSDVKGLATAATIWNAGAIGLASGFGNFAVAVLLSLVNFFSLLVLDRLDRR